MALRMSFIAHIRPIKKAPTFFSWCFFNSIFPASFCAVWVSGRVFQMFTSHNHQRGCTGDWLCMVCEKLGVCCAQQSGCAPQHGKYPSGATAGNRRWFDFALRRESITRARSVSLGHIKTQGGIKTPSPRSTSQQFAKFLVCHRRGDHQQRISGVPPSLTTATHPQLQPDLLRVRTPVGASVQMDQSFLPCSQFSTGSGEYSCVVVWPLDARTLSWKAIIL